ncbi:MAG: FAD-dependent oxidoreductase, partial [Oscillospiraceae bacterium]|nr:FAD-dependent oxidoreductase [Oscillospiraceae bacterium]
LCEKTGGLGGALLCEETVPFKEKLALYLARQARRVARAGVEVRLNTAVTPELAAEIAPDVIIASLGARPVVPNIPGMDGEIVVLAEDVYRDPSRAGQTAVIMGGGLVGLELGIFLAQSGREVSIVEMASSTLATQEELATSERIGKPLELEPDANIVHGIALAQQLKKLPSLKVFTSTKALEVTPSGLVVEGRGGVHTLAADTVICAVGQRALSDESLALNNLAPEFYMLGDCVAPKNIRAATAAAYQLARDIGRM